MGTRSGSRSRRGVNDNSPLPAKVLQPRTPSRARTQPEVSEGHWIEVTNRQVPPEPGGADHWVPIDGKEQVIMGDLSILAEGTPVEVAPAEQGTKVASETPTPADRPAET